MKQVTQDQTQPAINNHFNAMLAEHREGEAISDLSEAMAEVTEAALLTGRAGSFSIKFTIKPAGGKSAVAVTIEDDIKVTLPKAEKISSIFFAHDGALVRNNPNQRVLNFAPVEGGQEEDVPRVKAAAVGKLSVTS